MSLTSHDELIRVAAQAWNETRKGTRTETVDIAGLGAVIEAVEPLIRLDEEHRIAMGVWSQIEPLVSWLAAVNTRVDAVKARRNGDGS